MIKKSLIEDLKKLNVDNIENLEYIKSLENTDDVNKIRHFIDKRIVEVEKQIKDTKNIHIKESLKADIDVYNLLYAEWMEEYVENDTE
jgi:ElaB/YqjD/DUF883 family membrane-anchored ribosome-binding protein